MVSRPDLPRPAPVPVLALDVPGAPGALALLDRLPEAEWVKVGLQLFTAAGPELVRELKARGLRVFLDLKYHDIPNTVARAVESAAGLGADLLTIHASGGRAMLEAAGSAARGLGGSAPRLLAVTLLTSLTAEAVAEAWGRATTSPTADVLRLARLATECGVRGLVASGREAAAIRAEFGREVTLLTPGLRLEGEATGDQARVVTPEEASRLEIDYVVVGRTVTAAADPAEAWQRVQQGIIRAARE